MDIATLSKDVALASILGQIVVYEELDDYAAGYQLRPPIVLEFSDAMQASLGTADGRASAWLWLTSFNCTFSQLRLFRKIWRNASSQSIPQNTLDSATSAVERMHSGLKLFLN